MVSVRVLIGKQISKIYKTKQFNSTDLSTLIAQLLKFTFNERNLILYTNTLIQIISAVENKQTVNKKQAESAYLKILQLINQDETLAKIVSLIAAMSFVDTVRDPSFGTNILVNLLQDKSPLIQAQSLNTLATFTNFLDFNFVKSHLKLMLLSDDVLPVYSALILIKKISLIDAQFCSEWITDIIDVMNKPNFKSQYLALDVLYELKKNDANYLVKIIKDLKSDSNDVNTSCFIIKVVGQITPKASPINVEHLSQILQKYLNSVRYPVSTEASGVILMHRRPYAHLITKALQNLSILSSSSNVMNRFSCAKLLCQFLFTHNFDESDFEYINKVNLMLTKLVMDSAQSISILALSAYLKGASISRDTEESRVVETVDRITNHYSLMSKEYKTGVISSFKVLASRFPKITAKLISKLNFWLLELTGCSKTDDMSPVIIDTLIYFFSQSLTESIQLEIIHALDTFIGDSTDMSNIDTILHILDFFGSSFITNKLAIQKVIQTLSGIVNVSLDNRIKEISLNSLMKIGMNNLEFKALISDYLNQVQSYECANICGYAKLCQNTLSLPETPSYVMDCINDEFAFDVDPLLELIEEQLKDASNESPSIDEFIMEKIPISSTTPTKQATKTSFAPTGIAFANEQDDVEQDSDKKAAEDAKFAESLAQKFPYLKNYVHSTDSEDLNENSSEIFIKQSRIWFKNHLVLNLSLENTVENLMMKNARFTFKTIPQNSKVVSCGSVELLGPNEPQNCLIIIEFEQDTSLMDQSIGFELALEVHDYDPISRNVSNDFSVEDFQFQEIVIHFNDLLNYYVLPSDTEFDALWSEMTQTIIPSPKTMRMENTNLNGVKSTLLTLLKYLHYIPDRQYNLSKNRSVMRFSGKTLSEMEFLAKFDLEVVDKKANTILVAGSVVSQDEEFNALFIDEIIDA